MDVLTLSFEVSAWETTFVDFGEFDYDKALDPGGLYPPVGPGVGYPVDPKKRLPKGNAVNRPDGALPQRPAHWQPRFPGPVGGMRQRRLLSSLGLAELCAETHPLQMAAYTPSAGSSVPSSLP